MNLAKRYAVQEGNPVIFNDVEAWWFAHGRWRPIDVPEVMMNAKPLTLSAFEARFGRLPQLPVEAFTE
jgi:hypothetical protein